MRSDDGLSDPNAPPTIGAIPTNGRLQHDRYERFDEDPMYPLKTVSKAEGSSARMSKSEGMHDVMRRNSGHSQGDSGSEKAIVQTRTTTVSYS